MLKFLTNSAKRYFLNLPGWHTNRKIVIIESDDWGSIRTRSKKDLDFFQKKGINVVKCHYMSNDSLASELDLIGLFDVLKSVKDRNNSCPIITANSLVANPDFDKIKESNFKNYYFEDFRKTLQEYPNHRNSFKIWNEGMKNRIFHPQFHGREHLNISRWMNDLRNNSKDTHLFFDKKMFGISSHLSNYKRGSYLAAFDGGPKEINFDRRHILHEGLLMFEKIFNYNSKTFIAPNYIWDKEIEKILYDNNINYIQSSSVQRVSKDFGSKQKLIRHYTGKRNNFGQYYMVRNCHFEPAQNQNIDWVDSCLSDIKIAFSCFKPAIISSHRVNYIGCINERNRSKNLSYLKQLLKKIITKWPDVEFMSSDQLGDLISKK